MQANSLVDHETHFNLISSDIMMRFSSLIVAKQITIETGSIHQEGEATLYVPAVAGSAMTGVGGVLADGAGIGGGHGGYGGGSDQDNYHSGAWYTSDSDKLLP